VRFEADGDSRKEVHTIVKLNNILGAREFARLAFDYNRSFQQIEIPLVRVTHANGGTSELLPSAITDAPNPAVGQFPAYHEVRVKSARILGLEEGDTVEYRVITTTTHHPLAPDFWLEHSFDRSGPVLEERYEIDLPSSRKVQLRINPETPATSTQTTGEGESGRTIYRWGRAEPRASESPTIINPSNPDIAFNTLFWPPPDWDRVSARFANLIYPKLPASREISEKAASLTGNAKSREARLEAIYEFVSKKVATVALPLGATGYRTRAVEEILTSGYATQEDKAALIAALVRADGFEPLVYLTLPEGGELVNSQFQHLLVGVYEQYDKWMDPSSEVAPFGMIPSAYRGMTAFCATAFQFQPGMMVISFLPKVPENLPFAASQTVKVDAVLTREGALSAKVSYKLRGDNELLLRVAFHRTPKEKWKDVAMLLSISDGFRGQVTSVNASDPKSTKEPFTVEYEISQPKFVDWAKKSVRIPVLLPQIGLPDPATKQATGAAAANIELGTPLDVEASLTMRLPPGTAVHTPVGTSVSRDYATFSAKYSATQNTLTASRHINFLARQIPTERSTDYNAFYHAVQNDQAQLIVLEKPKEPSSIEK